MADDKFPAKACEGCYWHACYAPEGDVCYFGVFSVKDLPENERSACRPAAQGCPLRWEGLLP